MRGVVLTTTIRDSSGIGQVPGQFLRSLAERRKAESRARRVALPAELWHHTGTMERRDHPLTELSPERSTSSDDVPTAAMDGRLVLEKREAVLERLKRRFSHIPPGVSLVDELIAERRAEARREEAGSAERRGYRKRGRPGLNRPS